MIHGKTAVLVVNLFIQVTEIQLNYNVFSHVTEKSMGMFQLCLDPQSQTIS